LSAKCQQTSLDLAGFCRLLMLRTSLANWFGWRLA
jgi:hypothetical protein